MSTDSPAAASESSADATQAVAPASTAPATEGAGKNLTIGKYLPWLNGTLDYTEKLVEKIPDELLHWRPNVPDGHFHFSLGEIAKHLADTRRMFARQLAGDENNQKGYWAGWDTDNEANNIGADGRVNWRFSAEGTKEEILKSLKEAREELQPWLDKSVEALYQTTEGTRKVFDKALTEAKEKGSPMVAEMEARGAATVNRILHALTSHESGHRGSLQTLLRIKGVDARGEH